MSLFRLASAQDYQFNTESGYWELKFDRRPVVGTRCDDPELGARQYNEARAKFKAKSKAVIRPRQVFHLVELVEWAIESGSQAQRKMVWALLTATSREDYSSVAKAALKVIPPHFDFSYYFVTQADRRLLVSVELRQQLIAAIEQDDE